MKWDLTAAATGGPGAGRKNKEKTAFLGVCWPGSDPGVADGGSVALV